MAIKFTNTGETTTNAFQASYLYVQLYIAEEMTSKLELSIY